MTVPNPAPVRERLSWRPKPMHEWEDRTIIVTALTVCLGLPAAVVLAALGAALLFLAIGFVAVVVVPLAIIAFLVIPGLLLSDWARTTPDWRYWR